jgi:hypothetical protein
MDFSARILIHLHTSNDLQQAAPKKKKQIIKKIILPVKNGKYVSKENLVCTSGDLRGWRTFKVRTKRRNATACYSICATVTTIQEDILNSSGESRS